MRNRPFELTAETIFDSPVNPLDEAVLERLRQELAQCPDVAFVHLPQVRNPEQGTPQLILFVWLVAAAMRTLKQALNLVSDVVASALPDGQALDLVILNSAPELLDAVERAGCLLLVRDEEERHNALQAAAQGQIPEPPRTPSWWWPFS